MAKQKKIIFALLVTVFSLLLADCTHYPSENIDKARIDYNSEQKLQETEDAEEPPETISNMLALLETCVGGQYVIGGQGDRLTDQFIKNRKSEKPNYFTKEQIEYLYEVSQNGKATGWRFPDYYAWDCSGLWWWSCNKLGLYPKHIDCTAYITYHLYCTPITKDELRPGDLVFYQNEKNYVVHMGIVGKNGYVFEAVSVFGGVVKKQTINGRIYDDIANGGEFTEPDWNIFGRPKAFE